MWHLRNRPITFNIILWNFFKCTDVFGSSNQLARLLSACKLKCQASCLIALWQAARLDGWLVGWMFGLDSDSDADWLIYLHKSLVVVVNASCTKLTFFPGACQPSHPVLFGMQIFAREPVGSCQDISTHPNVLAALNAATLFRWQLQQEAART